MPTSLGVYDGRIVELDTTDHAHTSVGAAIPAVLPVAPAARRGVAARPGLTSTRRQGVGLPLGPANPLPVGSNASSIQQCPGTFCAVVNLIPRRCQYTPVLRSASGSYCTGCTIDICPEQTGRQARQHELRIRQRLCRRMGICLDRSQRPVRPGVRPGGAVV